MNFTSSATDCCMQCRNDSSPFKRVWKCPNGEYVQLCLPCYSLYEAGEFCETFHADQNGWIECDSCRKRFHCRCIVSRGVDDGSGGIICKECSKTRSLME